MHGLNSFYRDYENLLIKNDELSKKNRKLIYTERLLKSQIKTLEKQNEKLTELKIEQENQLKEQEYEIARLKALLNMDGTNHGIPTAQTPINKKKVIPTTREKTELAKSLKIIKEASKKIS